MTSDAPLPKTLFKEVLSHLSDGEPKTPYSIHLKYKIGPGELHEVVEELISAGLIVRSEDSLRLVDDMSAEQVALAKSYYFSEKPKLERSAASMERLPVNAPYLPDRDWDG